uniref:Uncharacterized protein n=1 Tax=Tetranychus urticae TaxID=32264 RepID=T1L5P8_TETUR
MKNHIAARFLLKISFFVTYETTPGYWLVVLKGCYTES